MIRKLMFGLALAAGAGLTIGCEAAKDTKKAGDAVKGAADKAKEGAKEGMEKAKEAGADVAKAAADKAKSEFLTPMEAVFPKVEEKIKGITDVTKMGAAKTAFEGFKKLVDEFKAAPADKFKDLMGGLTAKFTELKAMVGL